MAYFKLAANKLSCSLFCVLCSLFCRQRERVVLIIDDLISQNKAWPFQRHWSGRQLSVYQETSRPHMFREDEWRETDEEINQTGSIRLIGQSFSVETGHLSPPVLLSCVTAPPADRVRESSNQQSVWCWAVKLTSDQGWSLYQYHINILVWVLVYVGRCFLFLVLKTASQWCDVISCSIIQKSLFLFVLNS